MRWQLKFKKNGTEMGSAITNEVMAAVNNEWVQTIIIYKMNKQIIVCRIKLIQQIREINEPTIVCSAHQREIRES